MLAARLHARQDARGTWRTLIVYRQNSRTCLQHNRALIHPDDYIHLQPFGWLFIICSITRIVCVALYGALAAKLINRRQRIKNQAKDGDRFGHDHLGMINLLPSFRIETGGWSGSSRVLLRPVILVHNLLQIADLDSDLIRCVNAELVTHITPYAAHRARQ